MVARKPSPRGRHPLRRGRADRVVRPYKVRRKSLQIPVFTEHEIGEEIEDGAEE